MKIHLALAVLLTLPLLALPASSQELTWDPSKLPAPVTGYDIHEAAKGLKGGDTPFDAILGQALKANPTLAAYLRHGIAQSVYVAAPVQQVGIPLHPNGAR